MTVVKDHIIRINMVQINGQVKNQIELKVSEDLSVENQVILDFKKGY